MQQLRDAYKILNPKGEIDAYCEIQDYGYRLGACYDDDLRFCACLGRCRRRYKSVSYTHLVSIARSIVNRPPILICDEPTGNLDPQTSLGIMRLLERINRTGTTILVATHDREMVDQMRRRVLALENGTLVRDQKKGVYGYDV